MENCQDYFVRLDNKVTIPSANDEVSDFVVAVDDNIMTLDSH